MFTVLTADFLFQSTPPVKAATLRQNIVGYVACISIHAAREGGDPLCLPYLLPISYFNPRRP